MTTKTSATAPVIPAPRFTVNAHGNAALQAKLEAAAPLLEALLLGTPADRPALVVEDARDTTKEVAA